MKAVNQANRLQSRGTYKRSVGVVIPAEGIVGPELHPPRAKLHRCVADEAADIGTHQWDTKQAKTQQFYKKQKLVILCYF